MTPFRTLHRVPPKAVGATEVETTYNHLFYHIMGEAEKAVNQAYSDKSYKDRLTMLEILFRELGGRARFLKGKDEAAPKAPPKIKHLRGM
jgi:hypothetical protein